MLDWGLVLILCLVGGFCILSSVLNWDWFFNDRKARVIVAIFGRTGARIFYILMGTAIIVGGLWSALNG